MKQIILFSFNSFKAKGHSRDLCQSRIKIALSFLYESPNCILYIDRKLMKQTIKERKVSLVIHSEVLLEKKAYPFSANSLRS